MTELISGRLRRWVAERGARAVAAAVVHTDHVVENGANVSDDVADNARLVEGRDDDPNVVVARVDAEQNTGSTLRHPG